MKESFENDPFEKLNSLEFKIQKITSAKLILKTAEKNGLDDVGKWITEQELQHDLNKGREIAFIAIPSIKPNSTNSLKHLDLLPAGVCVGGYEEEGRVWIELLVVGPQFRRKGLATALTQSLIDEAREKSYRAVFVDLDDDNQSAYSFYKKFGFEDAGKIVAYYYDESDAIVLIYNINKASTLTTKY